MGVETEATGAGGGEPKSYFAAAEKVVPQSVQGTFRKIKWIILVLTLAAYYLAPFIRWDRGPNAPDQALLLDMEGRRFYFFNIEIWPQEIYYITGLLVLASLILFLMNAVAGRVWCGYLCPQTVWTDLFLAVERLVEGDRRDRIKLDKAPWTANKLGRRALKHFLWLMIAWWTGGAWVLYFGDAPTMVVDLATGQASITAYVWIAILTFTTYALAGLMREQVCIFMCPWPRIQAAMTDDEALNVTYRIDRGEPRGSLKKMKQREAEGLPAGDCIDCGQCVVVCPTGTDIRKGSQLSCIQCGLCIDACNNVMDKIGKPHGLVAYDTDNNILRREKGEADVYRPIRPRTILYTVIIVLAALAMLYVFSKRSFEDVNVLHDRNPIYVQLSDGGVRNGYTVRFLNKEPMERTFELIVDGLPQEARVDVVGNTSSTDEGWPLITVGADQTREVRALIVLPGGVKVDPSTDVVFRIKDTETGVEATAVDFFKAP